jgi:hypothetical protein
MGVPAGAATSATLASARLVPLHSRTPTASRAGTPISFAAAGLTDPSFVLGPSFGRAARSARSIAPALGANAAADDGGLVLAELAPPEPPVWARPFVYGGIALAILLLGLAAVPHGVIPGPRTASLVVYRRQRLGAVGLAVLAGALVVYLVSVL